MATRKTTSRKPANTTATRRRKPATRTRKSSGKLENFFVPMFFIVCILFCLGFLLFMGYRTVTASSFFEMKNLELRGVERIQAEKIKQIVKSHTVQNGVWNADVNLIKREIEEFRLAKDVSVSRVLPDTMRIIVDERIPVALVRLDGKDFWVDEEGLLLERVGEKEKRPPFTMFGWDEGENDKAKEKNKKRIELYLKLLEDWKSSDLANRVKAVDLTDLRQPQAIVEKSSKTIEIRLEGEDYVKSLQKGIETVAGSESCIEYVITDGIKTTKADCKS